MDFNEKIEQFQTIINESQRIVFFGGAGVSTESGIPDFRSADGIYNETNQYPPEQILSHEFFLSHTDLFYKFYRSKMLYPNAQPSITHQVLEALESNAKLTSVITQNIDGLHQRAGSENVVELHGSVERNYCMKCQRFFDVDEIFNSSGVPLCECGGIIKPDVVLYGEALDDTSVDQAIKDISNADTLIIGGTSLSVYPAASFIDYFKGKHIVVINKGELTIRYTNALVFNNQLGDVFSKIHS